VQVFTLYASDIDFEQKGFVDGGLFLYFSGISYKTASGDDESMASGESVSEEGSGDEGSESDSDRSGDDAPAMNLFEPNVFHNLLRKLLTQFVESGYTDMSGIHAAIRRHRTKILEALEEDPHEMFANFLIPDITRYFLAKKYRELI
jgi:hypothetical protein